MKKMIALLLTLTMVLALTACGSKKENTPENEDSQVEENLPLEDEKPEAPVEEPEAPAEEPEVPAEEPKEEVNTPAEKPAEKPAQKPAEKPAQKPTEKPAQKPAEKPAEKPAQKPAEKPAQKPAEKPAQKPAEKPADKTVDLSAFAATLTSGENWPGMMAADAEVQDALYAGMGDIAAKQKVVYTTMISAVVGEVALVEVENNSDVQKVKDLFQARISYQVGDENNPGAAWYPDSIDGWKNNSRVVSNGNYVMLVAGESCDAAVKAFNALFA